MTEDSRHNWTCESHQRLEQKIDDGFNLVYSKLDDIVSRQMEYSERLITMEQRQISVEKIVSNGLSHNVQNIVKRLDELEDFSWFRKPVTEWRDHLFIYIFKLSLIGAGLYLAIHFSDKIAKGFLK